MTVIRANLRRLVIMLAAFGVAMFGLASSPAYAHGKSHDDKRGEIKVCKKVQGPADHLKFKFVVKEKTGKKVKEFTLRKNECKKVDVDKGKHSVTEYVPKGCSVKMIHVKNNKNINIKDPKRATVWVDVKKDKKTEVTFFDKCKKDDKKKDDGKRDDHKKKDGKKKDDGRKKKDDGRRKKY